jgi:hypothetical protein
MGVVDLQRARLGGTKHDQGTEARCATYLNCDDGAEAIEASADRPGKEKDVEL